MFCVQNLQRLLFAQQNDSNIVQQDQLVGFGILF